MLNILIFYLAVVRKGDIGKTDLIFSELNYSYSFVDDKSTTTNLQPNDDWFADILSTDPAPFVPQPHDDTDTAYFDARNNMQEWKVSQFIDNAG